MFRIGLIGLCLAGLLSGCAAVDSSVAPRYNTVSRNFARARNEAILLNVVRAEHDDPLSFATISEAVPKFTNNTTVALPIFAAGPGASRLLGFSDKVLGDTASIDTQFTLSTNETREFYNALLHPVDLHVVNYFIRQGYSRELLFWLFADRVQVQQAGINVGYEYNPLYNYGCPLQSRLRNQPCFRDWAEIATITGLTVEERAVRAPDNGGGKKSGETSVGRICFDRILEQQGQAAMRKYSPGLLSRLEDKYLEGGRALRTLSPICGTPWTPKLSLGDTLDFTVNHITFRIVPRSPYGIYQFLGQLVRQKMSGKPVVPPTGYSERQVLPELATTPDRHIIEIVKSGGSGCYVSTDFFDGDYCVPRTAYNTKRIIGLLAALTALQTSAADLAITPTVYPVQ